MEEAPGPPCSYKTIGLVAGLCLLKSILSGRVILVPASGSTMKPFDISKG